MAREIFTRVWCDRCAARDEHTEATIERTIALGRAKPRSLDLCEPCDKELLGELAALLDEHGIVTAAAGARPAPTARARPGRHWSSPEAQARSAARAAEPTECPICHEVHARGSIVGHIWTQHIGYPREIPLTCPECGFVPPPSVKSVATAVGIHRARAHRTDLVAEAVAVYEHAKAATASGAAAARKHSTRRAAAANA